MEVRASQDSESRWAGVGTCEGVAVLVPSEQPRHPGRLEVAKAFPAVGLRDHCACHY